jgi:predicted MFS family arabinose efflux permease
MGSRDMNEVLIRRLHHIDPLLHTRAGLGARAITLVLLGFGLSGAVGNFIAGGVIYDAAGPGGALAVAAAVAPAGSLALLGRAGAAISSPSAGSADLAREVGRVVPAPSQGATDRAGSSAQRTR